MEHTEFTNNGCKNNYTDETFLESFAVEEEDIKKCNNCQYCSYEDGLITCKKFNS